MKCGVDSPDGIDASDGVDASVYDVLQRSLRRFERDGTRIELFALWECSSML